MTLIASNPSWVRLPNRLIMGQIGRHTHEAKIIIWLARAALMEVILRRDKR